MVAMPSLARAEGGYAPKSPEPFTAEEVNAIEKCRALAEMRGVNSFVFVQECSAVMPYVIH
jgi:hypothetical protein